MIEPPTFGFGYIPIGAADDTRDCSRNNSALPQALHATLRQGYFTTKYVDQTVAPPPCGSATCSSSR